MMREITPLLSAGCKLSFKMLKYKEASEDHIRNSSCLIPTGALVCTNNLSQTYIHSADI